MKSWREYVSNVLSQFSGHPNYRTDTGRLKEARPYVYKRNQKLPDLRKVTKLSRHNFIALGSSAHINLVRSTTIELVI